MMEEQVFTLKAKVAQYEQELEVLQWYIQVFEDGKDTKEILAQYYTLKKEHEVLKEKNGKTIAKLTKQNIKMKKENSEII